jgi:pimeloyl-ACP methyl ester carboxylesterase
MVARVRAGEVQLGWRQWGEGDVTVVFIHGNLASKDWIELAAPLFPSGVRVIGIDWRGCGESDRPPPAPDFSNYSMRQHALDMLAALDELEIPFCHLATHSTGGIIAARMLLKQPERFGRVFALDPVTPLGMAFNAEQTDLFRSMMTSRELTRAVMATAAASLFVPESLAPNTMPRAFARASLRSRRSTNASWSRHSVCPRASGSGRPSTSIWNGRAVTWNGAWRRSGIRIWWCGARRMAGLLLPISRPWQQPCRIAG